MLSWRDRTDGLVRSWIHRARRVGREQLVRAVREAAGAVLPVGCAGCGEPHVAVCQACEAALVGEVRMRTLGSGLRVWFSCDYGGTARRVILALKNHQRTDTSRALGAAFGTTLRHAGTVLLSEGTVGSVDVVPLPSTAAASRRRGYSPVIRVLRAAGIHPARGLAYARQPVDQIGLGVVERRANLAGVLVADRRVRGHSVVIADDVVTTGATLEEAQRALIEGGARVLGAVCCAATPRKFSRQSASF